MEFQQRSNFSSHRCSDQATAELNAHESSKWEVYRSGTSLVAALPDLNALSYLRWTQFSRHSCGWCRQLTPSTTNRYGRRYSSYFTAAAR